MANYTMVTRTICESLAGYTENQGFSSIDTVIEKSWNKIFTTPIVFYKEGFKERICKKILKAYYMREICCETAALWMYYLNQKMEEIEPYYSQLFKSAELDFDPLENINFKEILESKNELESDAVTSKDQTTDHNKEDNEKISKTVNNNSHEEMANNHENLYSDTPQNGLAYVENASYLTDARFEKGGHTINSNDNINESNTRNSTTKEDSTLNETESIAKTEGAKKEQTITRKGNTGENFSEMLLKFRETILNIDSMIISEFKDCFMILY